MSIPARITHNMMAPRMVADLQRSDRAMAKTNEQITSTKRINSIADDPLGTQRALRLKAELSEIDSNRTAAQAADGWLSMADTALSKIDSIIHRVRELVVGASNGTLLPEDRKNSALELEHLLEEVKAAGNAKYGDQYVFSGQSSQTPPYTAGASDTFAGDTLAVVRTIGPGQSLQVNVSAGDVFGGTPGDGKLLDTMRNAIAYMNGSTPADLDNLRGATLQGLTRNLDQVLTAQSTIGAAQNRVELADASLAELSVAVESQLSNVEDTDMAAALTQLSSQQTAYQAALAATAKVSQTSLMDFLR